MEANALFARIAACERAEPGERLRRVVLVEQADRGGDLSLGIVGREGGRSRELTLRRNRPAALLEPHAAEEAALNVGDRAGEARLEVRQPGRRVRMQEIARLHRGRRVRLEALRLPPGRDGAGVVAL